MIPLITSGKNSSFERYGSPIKVCFGQAGFEHIPPEGYFNSYSIKVHPLCKLSFFYFGVNIMGDFWSKRIPNLDS